MPDYKDIYNDVVNHNPLYVQAQNSPGLRIVLQSEAILSHFTGRSLDVGCGVGFAYEYLSRSNFNVDPYGVDISDDAIAEARRRLSHLNNVDQRLTVIDSQTLPFEESFFALVTCFDVLEHLDETDINDSLDEIDRVLQPGGTFLGAVSCRKAGSCDKFGDNLHRTIQSTDWWIQKTAPDRAIYDGSRQQFVIWKRKPIDGGSLFGSRR